MTNKNVAPLKVALAGFGTGGATFHAPFIEASKQFEFAAILTSNTGRRAQARQLYPHVALYDNLTALLAERSDIDLVVITTPNNTHHALALQALDKGCHVLVDKPFALTVAQAHEMLAKASAKKKVICPYQNRRYDSDFLTLKSIIEGGNVGKLLRLESRIERYRLQPKAGGWRETTSAADGGGVLYDLGSHLIDQIVHLFGKPTELAYARLTALRGLGTADDAALILHYDDFAVHIHASMICGDSGPRFRLLGIDGAFVKTSGDPQEDSLKAGQRPDSAGFGEEDPTQFGIIKPGAGEAVTVISEKGNWLEFYEGMARAIRGDAPPPVSGGDILTTLEIIEKALALNK